MPVLGFDSLSDLTHEVLLTVHKFEDPERFLDVNGNDMKNGTFIYLPTQNLSQTRKGVNVSEMVKSAMESHEHSKRCERLLTHFFLAFEKCKSRPIFGPFIFFVLYLRLHVTLIFEIISWSIRAGCQWASAPCF
ncbi:uncharacterized protein EV154DRAFT_478548 [Mucor mucedo]|uniref:uncharacterized protein n=1 Tax=Mucor mucedo TaxID=29922 RepID=UPI0022204A09|nr:uncharacterized protein EV154DRAFT_478548 [Mucor mucedo]KAI7894301.1 hypothetical protein EV154DRAFT_478548 [Mucor mucedo]